MSRTARRAASYPFDPFGLEAALAFEPFWMVLLREASPAFEPAFEPLRDGGLEPGLSRSLPALPSSIPELCRDG